MGAEHGCHWDEKTCALAAQEGHLEALQWLRADGCHWDQKTCALAAQESHLEALQWLRANGCPWDKRTCAVMASRYPLAVQGPMVAWISSQPP